MMIPKSSSTSNNPCHGAWNDCQKGLKRTERCTTKMFINFNYRTILIKIIRQSTSIFKTLFSYKLNNHELHQKTAKVLSTVAVFSNSSEGVMSCS